MINKDQDRQRARWRRLRRKLALTDAEDEEFGRAGLARFLDHPTVRLLILPGDPEADVIGFDDDFWAWFRADREDPVTSEPSHWGTTDRPTACAAVSLGALFDGK